MAASACATNPITRRSMGQCVFGGISTRSSAVAPPCGFASVGGGVGLREAPLCVPACVFGGVRLMASAVAPPCVPACGFGGLRLISSVVAPLFVPPCVLG